MLANKGYSTVSQDSPLPQNKDLTESEARGYQLKNPGLAALLAWLVPGLGHMYQGRWAKGIIFFVCILGTFFYGIALGSSHVVYTSMRPYDQRYYYFVCQAGVGLPALPALVQAWRVRGEKAPLWNGWMAPPVMIGQTVPADWAREQMSLGKKQGDFEEGDFLPAPNDPDKMVYAYRGNDIQRGSETAFQHNEFKQFQLSIWHAKYSFKYDLGTTFTMVAGLLNILVIFDAFAGPMLGTNLAGWETERKRREALAEQERAEQNRQKAAAKSGSPAKATL